MSRSLEQRASAALDLARACGSGGDFERAGRVCLDALLGLDDASEKLVVPLEAELITVALNEFRLPASAATVLMRRVEQAREGRLEHPELQAAVGLALAVSVAPARDSVNLARRAAAAGFPADNSLLPGSIGNALLFAGELAEAHRYISSVAEESRRRGLKLWLAWCSGFAARYSLQLGQIRRAEDEAQLGLELMEELVAIPGRTCVRISARTWRTRCSSATGSTRPRSCCADATSPTDPPQRTRAHCFSARAAGCTSSGHSLSKRLWTRSRPARSGVA